MGYQANMFVRGPAYELAEFFEDRQLRFPDECPLCHFNISPEPLFIREEEHDFEMVSRCPRIQCGRLFISYYEHVSSDMVNDIYEYHGSVPVTPRGREIDERITKISPSFSEIYHQAEQAEQLGLDQICGVGYRKSLEFLIKDYAISKNPDDAEEIQGLWLGTCIKRYLPESELKGCAERASWLGNDETHYTRKWEGKDVNDLKKLIELTLHWFIQEVVTAEYLESMGDD